jgi:hypothetical protein
VLASSLEEECGRQTGQRENWKQDVPGMQANASTQFRLHGQAGGIEHEQQDD